MFALDIEDVFVASWKRFSSSLGQVVLLTLLYLVGVFVVLAPLIFMFFLFFFSLMATAIGTSHGQYSSLVKGELATKLPQIVTTPVLLIVILAVFAVIFILPPLSAGWMYGLRNLLISGKFEFGDLFSQFGKIIHLVVAAILISLLALLGFLMLLLPGIFVLIIFSQTWNLIIDRDMDVFTAMGQSASRVLSHFLPVTGILVVLFMAKFGVSAILNVVPAVGSLVQALMAAPYFVLAQWVLYFALFPPQLTPQTQVQPALSTTTTSADQKEGDE